MPLVARVTDLHKTGHPCAPVAPLAPPTGNATVFANFKLMCRLGDLDVPHTILVPCPPTVCCVPHFVPLLHGFPKVMTVMKPQSHVGSAIDLGAMVQGSPTVYAAASAWNPQGNAGGDSLADVGAGSKYDGGAADMGPSEF